MYVIMFTSLFLGVRTVYSYSPLDTGRKTAPLDTERKTASG